MRRLRATPRPRVAAWDTGSLPDELLTGKECATPEVLVP